jgi:hypothetical protein
VHVISAAALLLHESMLASLSQLHLHRMQCQLHPATKAFFSSLFRLSLDLDRSCLLSARPMRSAVSSCSFAAKPTLQGQVEGGGSLVAHRRSKNSLIAHRRFKINILHHRT